MQSRDALLVTWPVKRLVFWALLSVLLGWPVMAQPITFALSQFSGGPDGVTSFQASPDGEWIVYTHDPMTQTGHELYSVRRDGSQRTRLSYPLPSSTTVWLAAITSDSQWVVYRVAQGGSNAQELWSVPIGGPSSASVRLSPTPVAGGNVFQFRLSPGGDRVVFSGDLLTVGRIELWSVPIRGPAAAAVRLNPQVASSASGVRGPAFDISADGSRVVFLGSISVANRSEIWSVPIAGPAGAAVRINPTPVPDPPTPWTVFEISPNSSRVVFSGFLESQDRSELWSVPIAGPPSAAVKLSPPPVAGGNVEPLARRISADGTRVIFAGDLETDGVAELWSVPITGPASQTVRLNPPTVPGGGLFFVYPPAFAGSRVVFAGDFVTDGKVELWSAPVAGPAASAVSLSGSLGADADVSRFAITPDGSRVVFAGDLVLDNRLWLFSRAIDGSGTRALLTEWLFTPQVDLRVWSLSPDSRWVAYIADRAVAGRFDLSRVRVAGGSTRRLTESALADVTDMKWTPDSAAIPFLSAGAYAPGPSLWIYEERIFADGFETGGTAAWSGSVP